MARRALLADGAYCSHCGSVVTSGAQLCLGCGQPLEGDARGTRCWSCRRAVDAEEASCPNCGSEIVAGKGLSEAKLNERLQAIQDRIGRKEAPRDRSARKVPQETEASLLAELESMWTLQEPFEKVVGERRKRLQQMDRLIAAVRRRIRELDGSFKPDDVREREELKRQVHEVVVERDEILKIEYGIIEMERAYRNVITMQQRELQQKEDALRGRLEGFQNEIASRDRERAELARREADLASREKELLAQIADLERRVREANARPPPTAAAVPGAPPEEPGSQGGVTRDQWLAAQREVQNSLFKLRGVEGEIVLPTAGNVRDLLVRVTELEESLEKLMDERNRLVGEIATLKAADDLVREVMREVDELLGKLPDEEIRRFTRSSAYKRYEELMDRLGL